MVDEKSSPEKVRSELIVFIFSGSIANEGKQNLESDVVKKLLFYTRIMELLGMNREWDLIMLRRFGSDLKYPHGFHKCYTIV